MRYDVALAACKSYEDAEVSAALETAVTAAGGLDWVTPGMRVALKLNLVSAMKPEEAATVHPAVVCALVRMLQARGAHVVLGDSPGGLYNAARLRRDGSARGRGAGCGAERGFFRLLRLVSGGRAGKELHRDGVSEKRGRDHRRVQAQDARDDGHDERRQELFRHHPRRDEAGISLQIPEDRGFCEHDRRSVRIL